MKIWSRWMLAAAVLLTVTAVGIYLFNKPRAQPEPAEPSYAGYTLTEWFWSLPYYPPGATLPPGLTEAIRHIGTNAIPHLLRWIRDCPNPVPPQSPLKRFLLNHLPNSLQRNPHSVPLAVAKRELRAGAARCGFQLLGPDAAPAIPELERMEQRRWEETDPQALKTLRRGWCLGSGNFKREMLAKMEGNLGEHHSGELHRQSADAKAERIVAEELKRRGWQEADVLARRKSDPDKLAIAARLRRETTLPLKTIAMRMHLGTSKTANAKLHLHMRSALTTKGAGPGATGNLNK